MTRAEIIEKLKDVIGMAMTSTGASPNDYTEESRLVDDLGLNSVGILYTVIAIEEFFSIRFDDVGFGDFRTVGDVIDYIEKKVNE